VDDFYDCVCEDSDKMMLNFPIIHFYSMQSSDM